MTEAPPPTRRDAYVTRMAVQLERLVASLAQLEARLATVGDDAPPQHGRDLASLHELAGAAARQLDAVRAADEARWDEAMAAMDEAWQAFRHAANHFQSRL